MKDKPSSINPPVQGWNMRRRHWKPKEYCTANKGRPGNSLISTRNCIAYITYPLPVHFYSQLWNMIRLTWKHRSHSKFCYGRIGIEAHGTYWKIQRVAGGGGWVGRWWSFSFHVKRKMMYVKLSTEALFFSDTCIGSSTACLYLYTYQQISTYVHFVYHRYPSPAFQWRTYNQIIIQYKHMYMQHYKTIDSSVSVLFIHNHVSHICCTPIFHVCQFHRFLINFHVSTYILKKYSWLCPSSNVLSVLSSSGPPRASRVASTRSPSAALRAPSRGSRPTGPCASSWTPRRPCDRGVNWRLVSASPPTCSRWSSAWSQQAHRLCNHWPCSPRRCPGRPRTCVYGQTSLLNCF